MDRGAIHVLLIEDDDIHAMIVEKGFRSSGAPGTIDRVRDGEAGVAYVRREGHYADRPRPQLILLDLKLPRLDGHEVLRILKSDDNFNMIPIVVLSTSAADNDVQNASRSHANSYLVKPVNFAEFRELIAVVVSYWGKWNRSPGQTGA